MFQLTPGSLNTRPVRILLGLLCVTGALALSSGGESARAAVDATPALIKVVFNLDGTISVTLADGTPVGAANPPGTVIRPASTTSTSTTPQRYYTCSTSSAQGST